MGSFQRHSNRRIAGCDRVVVETMRALERSIAKQPGSDRRVDAVSFQQTANTRPSPRRRVHSCSRLSKSSRQVFGLAGYLLAPASQFMAEPVLLSERSFLLTAAGQFRILTGFPFNPNLAIRHREVVPVYRALHTSMRTRNEAAIPSKRHDCACSDTCE